MNVITAKYHLHTFVILLISIVLLTMRSELGWSCGINVTPTPTPTPGGLQPLGAPAPSGKHWVVTYDDEFTNDSSIGSQYFITPQGGGNAQVFLSGANGLVMQPFQSPNGCNDFITNCNQFINIWRAEIQLNMNQRFGFWEVVAKFPHDDNGEGAGHHPDVGLMQDTFQFNGHRTFEMDACEQQTPGATYGGWSQPNNCANFVHDNNGTLPLNATWPVTGSGAPLGDAFHTYGLQWLNDGTAHGTQSMWFDGQQQSNTIFSYDDPNYDHGFYWDTIFDGCYGCSSSGNNPLMIKYLRIWQAQ